MADDHDYFQAMVEAAMVRTGARAIILNNKRDHVLVEKNHGARDDYLNFIGGGVALGETLEDCLQRELQEETNARATRLKYLFVVENFITFKGDITHGFGHYFEVSLDREDVTSTRTGVDCLWLPISELGEYDLRPHVVRDCLTDGSYPSVRHLLSKDVVD